MKKDFNKDLIILNLLEITKKSIFKEFSNLEKGFFRNIVSHQNIKYQHYFKKDYKKLINIKIKIVQSGKFSNYKLYLNDSHFLPTLNSLYLFIKFIYWKFSIKSDTLYLIGYNEHKIIVISQLDFLKFNLLEISKILRIRFLFSNLYNLIFVLIFFKAIIKKEK